MGVSPAEPLQVVYIIGGIVGLCLILSLTFYTRQWMKNNPGVLKNRIVQVEHKFVDSVNRIIQHLKKSGFSHVMRNS